MGKKKFINKKKSATFTLVYRETGTEDDPTVPVRQFTRIDGGDSYVPGFTEDDPRSQIVDESWEDEEEEEREQEEEESDGGDSRFDDADEESGADEERDVVRQAVSKKSSNATGHKGLPDKVRRELIELGFPDDGYDYNKHMRTIGPGGAFVPSTRAPVPLRPDIKAYDASQVGVQAALEGVEAAEDDIIELVSSRTRPVRKPLSKDGVLDADIIAALENSDGSQFDSADELDDEFVIFASEGVEDRASGPVDGPIPSGRSQMGGACRKQIIDEESDEEEAYASEEDDKVGELPRKAYSERPARLLDQRFETLASREYDDFDIGELDEDNPLARGNADISKFSSVLSEFLSDMDIHSEKYETIAQSTRTPTFQCGDNESSGGKAANMNMVANIGMDDIVVKKTLELGGNESDSEVVVVPVSDEEVDEWDCETVVSTYSNLDNHPAKITAPGCRPRLQDVEKAKIIRLGGKQHLPLDYLPAKPVEAKQDVKPVEKEAGYFVKVAGPRAGETPAERKARKALIKENRREARVAKKTTKICYRGESHRAQRGAATMGPSAIHLA